jgi:hypothetical protein
MDDGNDVQFVDIIGMPYSELQAASYNVQEWRSIIEGIVARIQTRLLPNASANSKMTRCSVIRRHQSRRSR